MMVRVAGLNKAEALRLEGILEEETRKKMSEALSGSKHPMFGKHHTEESRKKMSIAGKGKYLTEEWKRKISESLKGNKRSLGHKHTEESKKKMSLTRKNPSEETRRNMSKAQKGRHHSEESKRKIGIAHKGMHHTEESKKKMSVSSKGKYHTEEHKKKIGKKSKERWLNPDYAKKMMKILQTRPNKTELQSGCLLDKILPEEYLYDGESLIGGRCPDFVNVNGQKKAIEIFGDYWHGEKRTGRTKEQEEKQRIEYFARYGWQTLIIWEHELKDLEVLKNRVLEFNSVKQNNRRIEK